MAGIVAADPVDAADAGVVDLGDEVVLAHARLDLLDDAGVHGLDDAAGLAHVVELGGAFDGPLPVHQRGGILEAGVGQVLLQRREGRGRELVIVHLDADRRPWPSRAPR